ncbi:ABC transporter ATP-binding protein [Pleurocapsa sp. PCC 7319]|uniref:ABC transporter ATP-binding protein n=1 Tax=Pleurocapsa sp. PCC 7319 TaxID=118161 RepID=UPI00034654BA|nr:ABC transporter ATP-binding protein [Pleurocapsa sp. PCC 7319]
MKQSVILQLKNITKTYTHRPGSAFKKHHQTIVLDNVSLTLKHGELLGLLGPSGCGKTSLLRIVAGFEPISQGTVEIAGKVVCTNCDSLAPEKRNTGMVFQDYALFPHLTVKENIAFGIQNKRKNRYGELSPQKLVSKSYIRQRVAEVLELVGLTGLESRYPHQLSGGQQQRISLARALAPQPTIILLDEPLSNLDIQVRHRLRLEIRSILKAAGTSAIFVTHDREEALAISDRVAVMRHGNIEQVGTPEEIYLNPASRFVAEFVTQANFLPATRKNQFWITEIGEVEIPENDCAKNDDYSEKALYDQGDLMLRQEDIILLPDLSSEIVVRERQFLGKEYHYCVETPSGKRLYARSNLNQAISVGTNVNLSLAISSPKIFPVSSSAAKQSLAKIS